MKAKINNQLLKTVKSVSKPFEVFDPELRGLILRVEPSGTLTYYCAYRIKATGKRGRYMLGRHPAISPMRARDEARRVLGDVAHGIDPMAAVRDSRQHLKRQTLGEFVNGDYKRWAETHFTDCKDVLRRICACFGAFYSTPLQDLDVFSFERWKADRIKTGIDSNTVNRDLTYLKAAIEKAVQWDMISVHPLKKLRPAKVVEDYRIRFLDNREESLLLEALDRRQEVMRADRDRMNKWLSARHMYLLPSLREIALVDHLKPMVLLSLHTGLRRGELFKLTWADIDVNACRLKVRGAAAKSGKARYVALNKVAIQAVVAWREQQLDHVGLVFPSKDGKPFNNVKKAWEKLLNSAGIRDFRWHDMRHHFASRLVMAGVDLNTVRELLGHADLKMTLRYAHLGNEVKAAAVELLVRAA